MSSYRQQLRRDLQGHRRDQGVELLNGKIRRVMDDRLAAALAASDVTREASTPVDPAVPRVS